MAAVYDASVRNQLYQYEKALIEYPISLQRRRNKVQRLRQFLQSLSRNPMAYPICDSKKLGQIFNLDGKPMDTTLRQANYTDESNTQWRISFLQISPKVVKTYRLIQSKFVDETIRKTIRLTEGQFKNLLAECLTKIIKKSLKRWNG